MPNYRRLYVPGGTYFFTVNLLDRDSDLLVRKITSFRYAMAHVKSRRPFVVDAMVILPDHIHTIWILPEGDPDFSTRWRLIKGAFSRLVDVEEWRSGRRVAKGERAIWQRRFWEHAIRDDEDHARCVDYCYWNPVKHGLVSSVREWPHSTYHRDVRCGRFAREIREDVSGNFGEKIDTS